jgi:hypothetical protein
MKKGDLKNYFLASVGADINGKVKRKNKCNNCKKILSKNEDYPRDENMDRYCDECIKKQIEIL